MSGVGVVETAACEALVLRMCQEFQGISPDQVRDHVVDIYADFADARVQAFVPVLVEKRLRAQLRMTSRALRPAQAATG